MTCRSITVGLLLAAALPLAGQGGVAVTMPAGNYVIQTRDTSATAEKVGMAGWPFVLKGNGDFVIMAYVAPDTLPFTGKLVQKGGLATYTDQSCMEPGTYYVRKEGAGYAFDVKSETCSESLVKLLFVPGKPKK